MPTGTAAENAGKEENNDVDESSVDPGSYGLEESGGVQDVGLEEDLSKRMSAVNSKEALDREKARLTDELSQLKAQSASLKEGKGGESELKLRQRQIRAERMAMLERIKTESDPAAKATLQTNLKNLTRTEVGVANELKPISAQTRVIEKKIRERESALAKLGRMERKLPGEKERKRDERRRKAEEDQAELDAMSEKEYERLKHEMKLDE